MAAAAAAPEVDEELVQLTQHAMKLRYKSHNERAIEKWRLALAAALRVSAPDCLVVAALRVEIVSELVDVVAGAREAGGDAKRALVADAFSMLSLALATLRRRRDAGTLLHGACRPAEEAWYAVQVDADSRYRGIGAVSRQTAARMSASLRARVGYYYFINAAGLQLIFTSESMQCSPVESVQPGNTLLSSAVAITEEAVALMVVPQPALDQIQVVYSGVELILVEQSEKLGHFLQRLGGSGLPFAAPLAARVAAALLRLRQSGVLEARGLSGGAARQVDAVLASGAVQTRRAACAPESCCDAARCPGAAQRRRTWRNSSPAPPAAASCTAARSTRRSTGPATRRLARRRAGRRRQRSATPKRRCTSAARWRTPQAARRRRRRPPAAARARGAGRLARRLALLAVAGALGAAAPRAARAQVKIADMSGPEYITYCAEVASTQILTQQCADGYATPLHLSTPPHRASFAAASMASGALRRRASP
jgi:hypothetical protein